MNMTMCLRGQYTQPAWFPWGQAVRLRPRSSLFLHLSCSFIRPHPSKLDFSICREVILNQLIWTKSGEVPCLCGLRNTERRRKLSQTFKCKACRVTSCGMMNVVVHSASSYTNQYSRPPDADGKESAVHVQCHQWQHIFKQTCKIMTQPPGGLLSAFRSMLE